jgi:hypothetical protein
VLLVLCPLFWDHQLKSLRMQGGTKVMEAPGKGPMRTLRSHYHIYICLKLAPSKIQFKFILLPVCYNAYNVSTFYSHFSATLVKCLCC